jgi:hypothetical protein
MNDQEKGVFSVFLVFLASKLRLRPRYCPFGLIAIFFLFFFFETASLCLGSVNDYKYLQGTHKVDGIDDREDYESVCNAMQTLGFEDETRMNIFRVVAVVLNLGNLEFEPKGTPDDAVKVQNKNGLFQPSPIAANAELSMQEN